MTLWIIGYYNEGRASGEHKKYKTERLTHTASGQIPREVVPRRRCPLDSTAREV